MGIERKPRKQTNLKENMGKLMLDIGKLVFGGMFSARVLRGGLPQTAIILSGLVATFGAFILGLLLTTKEEKTVENKE